VAELIISNDTLEGNKFLNMKRRDKYGDQAIDGRVILIWIMDEYVAKI
jgi:hypothetical protein